MRKLLKVTNDEFKETYGLSKEDLLRKYPFSNNSIKEMQNWDENKGIFEEGLNARRKWFIKIWKRTI